MAEKPDIVQEALVILSHKFDTDEGSEDLLRSGAVTMEEVRHFVVEHVSRLLNHNPALLMSILYRVDVAEVDVKNVLAYVEPSRIPFELADLLIERQIQKLKVRRAYRDENTD